MDELVARINAILKRVTTDSASYFDDLEIGKLTFNPKMQILSMGDFSVTLTTKESDLLTLLYKNKNNILDRNHALKAIWGDDNYFNGRMAFIRFYQKLLSAQEIAQNYNATKGRYGL